LERERLAADRERQAADNTRYQQELALRQQEQERNAAFQLELVKFLIQSQKKE